MRKWKKLMDNLLTGQLELPSDVILELPRITTIGQLHAYIENHKGLILFSDTELHLKMKDGYLRIAGEQFVLKMMLPEEILLEGKIKALTFVEE